MVGARSWTGRGPYAARLIDDGQYDDWAKLFIEDGSYKIVIRENADDGYPAALMMCKGAGMVRDRILALREANYYNPHYDRHVIGNVRILDETDGVYSVHSASMVAQTTLDGRSSLFSVGKYLDQVARVHRPGPSPCSLLCPAD